MKGVIVPIVLACLVVSSTVGATGKGNGRMGMSQAPVFVEIDINQDGLISEEEFVDFQKARQELRKSEGRLLRNSYSSDDMFERIDTNNDAFIDMAEFQTHKGSMRASKL